MSELWHTIINYLWLWHQSRPHIWHFFYREAQAALLILFILDTGVTVICVPPENTFPRTHTHVSLVICVPLAGYVFPLGAISMHMRVSIYAVRDGKDGVESTIYR